MSRRHQHRDGDWDSVARRLDEIISAHSGEDTFEEAFKLLVGKLAAEQLDGAPGFLGDAGEHRARLDALLSRADAAWPGALEDTRTKLAETELARCAEVLAALRLSDDGLVGLDAIFEFISTKAAKGQKGQFFTPRYVIDEVVQMMGIEAGETVLDPACGSGGFLRHALTHQPACSVHGVDLDPRAARVARVMLAASGVPCERVRRDDSLQRVGDQGFDVILTNPPFAGDVGEEFRACYDLAQTNKKAERDVLFLERCVELLRPGGRLAMVLPHNKLGSGAWAFVREWLLRRMQVQAVVGLGRNTFMPHTSIKACVLFATKREAVLEGPGKPAEEIFFFVSERDGKDTGGRLQLDATGAVDHDLAEARAGVRARFTHGGGDR